eukprot:11493406-Alexandrium_andersonii.AAC.1
MGWLRWCIGVMGSGRFPEARDDGTPFKANESWRAEAAGKSMKFRSIIQFFKGDWVEFAERFGFPSHSHSLRPCFCCSASPGPAMFQPAGVSLFEAAWHENIEEDFQQAMAACE